MPHPLIRTLLAASCLLAGLATPLDAQSVTPSNRVLVVDAGKTASFRVRDTDGCSPT